MRRIIIYVEGGVVDVKESSGLNIGIVDFDLEEFERNVLTGEEDVVIEVHGGVAWVVKCADDVEVEIIDLD